MGLLNQLNDILLQTPKRYWGDKATRLGSLLSDSASTGAQAYGSANSPMAPEHSQTLAGLLADFTPGLGDVKSAYDGMQSAREGDYLGAALGGLGALPLVPNLAGSIKPLSAAQELLKQSSDGWSKAIGDSGEFITKKFYPLPVTINDKTINFAAHKNSGGGPLHLTRLADTQYGQVLRTYKVAKDGNLVVVGDKNLFALTPEARQYHIDEYNSLFRAE